MKKYFIDTSYFSNMLEYYPIEREEFNFIWESLKSKILNDEIYLSKKVYKELEEIKDDSVNEYLKNFTEKLIKANKEYEIKLAEIYEDNKNYFSGSFDKFSKEDSADFGLIALVLKEKTNNQIVTVLCDEILPLKANKKNKKKLNIPSLCERIGIECLMSNKKNINIFI